MRLQIWLRPASERSPYSPPNYAYKGPTTSQLYCLHHLNFGTPDVNEIVDTAAATRNQSGKCRCSSNICKKCNIWIPNSKHTTKLKTCPLWNTPYCKSLGHLFSHFHCAKEYYQLLRCSLTPMCTQKKQIIISYVYVLGGLAGTQAMTSSDSGVFIELEPQVLKDAFTWQTKTLSQ